MTVAEAIDMLNSFPHFNGEQNTQKIYNSVDMAVKSLEAWEKVRTEIETEANAYPYGREYYLDMKIEGLETALEIIDKHLKGVTE